MARTNQKTIAAPVFTHQGGRAQRSTPLQELERTVATCLLWEPTFYSSGEEIAVRIADLCTKVSAKAIHDLAVKARSEWKLRHVPLFLTVQLIKKVTAVRTHRDPAFDGVVLDTIAKVVRRPDEMGELLSIYWKLHGKKVPLAAQLKKGLAEAFGRFDEYQLAKWDRDADIKLRDVMRLVHPRPEGIAQASLWKRVLERTLKTPDTWEVGLSAAKTDRDKKAVWTRLLAEGKLGYMALLQNLRNMDSVHVDPDLIENGLVHSSGRDKALPFRYVAAAKAVPHYTDVLSTALVRALGDWEKLPGTTALVVDVSGSMDAPIAEKSTINRWEAASALGVVLREVCQRARVFTFSYRLVEVPNVRGLGLVNAIGNSQAHGGTHLAGALKALRDYLPNLDRLVVVTDEQSQDGNIKPWCDQAYLINVAPYKYGLSTSGGWTRVNGWSEGVVQWMLLNETCNWYDD